MSAPMICIDARMLQASGIGTYLQGLLGAIADMPRSPISFTLLGDTTLLPSGPWTISPVKAPLYSIREQWRIPMAFRRTKAAILHAPHYNMPWLLANQTVVTVHDLIHLKFPEYWPSLAARAYARFFFYRVVPQARAILTVSESTKRDLMSMLAIPSEQITVTYPAVDHERFSATESPIDTEFDQLKLPRDYLLYVGNFKEFKNVPKLLEAYASVRQRHPDSPDLVLVGRNFIPGFEHQIQKSDGVHWLGEIRRELLPSLYKHALIFIFPSLYEGFGLPPLEAMACGTPVICSDRASLPEVVGDAALLINPTDLDNIVAAMERLIQDSSLRRDLSARGKTRAKQFSWDRMATQTLEVYKRCLL